MTPTTVLGSISTMMGGSRQRHAPALPGPRFRRDRILNGTDNCLAVSNPAQADADSDDHGDACDCDSSDSELFTSPLEIVGFVLPTEGCLSWDSDAAHSGSSTEYDVLSGALAELPVGGGSSERCIAAATPITIECDAEDPAPGTGFYYLVRGRNACGVGAYGEPAMVRPAQVRRVPITESVEVLLPAPLRRTLPG